MFAAVRPAGNYNDRPMRTTVRAVLADAMTSADVTKLIELGREREAARLATATGGHVDPRQQFEQVGPLLAQVVSGITRDQLANPTPCAEFTVSGVLEHMISGATTFAAAFRGGEVARLDTSDPLDGFLPALGGLAEAVDSPGALDRTIHAPFGDLPGSAFLSFVVLDGLVHGFDLAMATGQAYDPPAQLVAEVEAYARAVLDPLRDGDTFAAAVEPPAGATPIQRLAAYTGRHVAEIAR
jgi:uncharacterized protein (TIGR03086 family)